MAFSRALSSPAPFGPTPASARVPVAVRAGAKSSRGVAFAVRSFVVSSLVALTVLGTAKVASADESPEYYLTQLKTSDDFRVRTQAALALGKKGDESFAGALCAALDDANEAVRAGAAGGLGKLKKGAGAACLREKLGKEKNADVRATIEKSLKEATASAGSGSSSGGGIPDGAKFYVSVGDTNNKTKRSKDDVDGIVKDALTKKLASMSGYAVAPRGEAAAKAKALMQSKRLKGFQLLTTVEPMDYSGGNLTVKVRVVLTTYPGKDIKGEFSNTLKQSGTPSEDKASEDELIKMNLEKAMESLQKFVSAM